MTRRRPVVALLATVVVPLTVIGAVALVVPRADAGTAPPVASDTVPPMSSGAPLPPTLTVTPPSTTPFPPGATTNLVASVVRTGSVTLTWTAAPRGCCVIAAYDITYTQAFNDIVWQTSVAGTATTATISTLSRASEYRFSVSARDDQGRRGAAASVTFVTPATDTGPDTTPPSQPANFAAGTVTAASATLSWSPSTDNGAVVTADSAAWNSAIPVGGSASFGFQGSWVGGNPTPTAFTLNGGPCTV